MNFLNIEYLKNGNERQQLAFQTLDTNQILEKLKVYNPILTGTIPINIDTESSDLDIICCWKEKQEFIDALTNLFSFETAFNLRIGKSDNSVICNFKLGNFEIEIFGQHIPTKQQNAYLHMLIEHQILQEKGEDFRLKIIELKQNGYKTEPAFAKLLGLKGDPYLKLLNYKIS